MKSTLSLFLLAIALVFAGCDRPNTEVEAEDTEVEVEVEEEVVSPAVECDRVGDILANSEFGWGSEAVLASEVVETEDSTIVAATTAGTAATTMATSAELAQVQMQQLQALELNNMTLRELRDRAVLKLDEFVVALNEAATLYANIEAALEGDVETIESEAAELIDNAEIRTSEVRPQMETLANDLETIRDEISRFCLSQVPDIENSEN